jgi:hypothetical protein
VRPGTTGLLVSHAVAQVRRKQTVESVIQEAWWTMTRAGVVLVCCFVVAGSAGCTTAGGSFLLNLPPLRGANTIPCSLAESARFVDYPDVDYRSYGGPIRPREAVAVLVTHNIWFVGSASTQLDLQAVDGQKEVQEQARGNGEETVRLPLSLRSGCGDTCFHLSVLPGRHVVALRAVSEESGKATLGVHGEAQFLAEAGGLYSLHVCRTKKDGRVFWVRDERAQACVSGVCPQQ